MKTFWKLNAPNVKISEDKKCAISVTRSQIVRISLEEQAPCWQALGVIHNSWSLDLTDIRIDQGKMKISTNMISTQVGQSTSLATNLGLFEE